MSSLKFLQPSALHTNTIEIVNKFEDIVEPVDNVLSNYYYKEQFKHFSYYYNLHKDIFGDQIVSPVVCLDNIVLCELNVGLWDKSFRSAVSNLTVKNCPHSFIVLNFIKYLMNSQPKTEFGLLKQFFHNLILIHPPRGTMFKYYHEILFDTSLILNEKSIGEQGLFTCLLEAIINCINDKELNVELEKNIPNSHEFNNLTDILYNEDVNSIEFLFKNVNFGDLPWHEQTERCLIAIRFIYDILETDFFSWINSKRREKSENKWSRPLMSYVLWPEERDMGLCNKSVCQIIKLFILGNKLQNCTFNSFDVGRRYLNLMAEVFRSSDITEEVKYPHLGRKTNAFVHKLSVMLYEFAENCKDENVSVMDFVCNITAPWLRLVLCSHLLSYIMGHQCLPELSSAYDILEHAACVTYKDTNERDKTSSESNVSTNWSRVQRLRKLKSVNTKRKGKTRLQAACETNDIEEIRALLMFPELDINGVDHEGWTALHLASQRGNEQCIRELLYNRNFSTRKTVNVRFRGPENTTPLMCAAVAGHAEICHLLLEHSGPVLLEDVNESNQTALDLSTNDEVTRILNHYKDNLIWTDRSRLCDVEYDEKYNELVPMLAAELIISYFRTYRTLQVFMALKKDKECATHNHHDSTSEINLVEWDYMRYVRDINNNMKKLKNLCPKVAHIKGFDSVNETFTLFLSVHNI